MFNSFLKILNNYGYDQPNITFHQAFNAILFLFRNILNKEMGIR